MREPCSARRQDGRACGAQALPSGPYCWAHDPAKDEQRREARSRGGRHSANMVRLRALVPPRLLPIFDRLEQALTQVHEGELKPQQASSMAALARAMVAVLTAGELEERVRTLEQRAESRGG